MSAATVPTRGVPLSRAALVLGVLFAVGVILGQVGLNSAGRGVVTAFKAIAGAHYRLYLARENLNAEGESEFAVLLADGGRAALGDFVAARPGWQVRDALIPGWVVVTAPDAVPETLAGLRDEAFSRAVLRNRGMWICH